MADNSLLQLFNKREKEKNLSKGFLPLHFSSLSVEDFLHNSFQTVAKYRKINVKIFPWKKNYTVNWSQKDYQKLRKLWETLYKITLHHFIIHLQPERIL